MEFEKDAVEELEKIKAIDENGNLNVDKIITQTDQEDAIELTERKKCLQNFSGPHTKHDIFAHIINCSILVDF